VTSTEKQYIGNG